VLLTSTQVDDDWSGGYVGLFRGNQDTNIHQFDDFKVGYDNNADGDFDDGGDVLAIDDNFGDSVTNGAISLSYDNNGNLTDDGIFAYAYDAWNRLRLAKLVVGGDETTIGDYEYYGDNRRSRKTVTNHGPEVGANDGGDTEVRFVYAGWRPSGDTMFRWSIVETRDGSNQTTFQHLWGTRYIDELIWIEKNGDPAEGDDTDPDEQMGESTADERYFVHQDRNWNIRMTTRYDTSGASNGVALEHASVSAYGMTAYLRANTTEQLSVSTLGIAFAHHAAHADREIDTYQNRQRQYFAGLERFSQRDPLGYEDGLNVANYADSNPITNTDPTGLQAQASASPGDCKTLVAEDAGEQWTACMCCGFRNRHIGGGANNALANWLWERAMDGRPASSCEEDAMQHCIGAALASAACGRLCACYLGNYLEARQGDGGTRDKNNNDAGIFRCGGATSPDVAVSCCERQLERGRLDITPDSNGSCS